MGRKKHLRRRNNGGLQEASGSPAMASNHGNGAKGEPFSMAIPSPSSSPPRADPASSGEGFRNGGARRKRIRGPEEPAMNGSDAESGAEDGRNGVNGAAHCDIEGARELLVPKAAVAYSAGKNGNGGGLRGDLASMGLLLVLYTLQGVPMGLSGSIPFLLHGRVSYRQQSFFSLASLPFSLKLLWAPLVDSVYHRPFGRRKSWLVPVQMLCGALMLGGASCVEAWVGGGGESSTSENGGREPQVGHLTAFFLVLYLLMATQDIAVDGWALTMLSRRNVGYASTCNTIGQTLGFFVAHVGFLALHDPGICNRYLRREPVAEVGLVTLESFMMFWGAVFVATTLFVWLGKKEAEGDSDEEVDGPLETYRQLLQCLRLPAVQSLCMVLLTCKAAFAVTDAATSLKLVERGMPKEELALLSPLLVAMGMAVPVIVGRLTAGPRPLSVFLFGYPLRIVVTIVYAAVLPMAQRAYAGLDEDDDAEEAASAGGDAAVAGRLGFYGALAGAVLLHEVASNCMYVSQMAFFARVSDPVIGGTYMTLLNTVANLGTKWPGALSLWAMDHLTWKACAPPQDEAPDGWSGDFGDAGPREWLGLVWGSSAAAPGTWGGACDAAADAEACEALGGDCRVAIDGYNVQVAVCTVVGMAWLALCRRRVLRLQEAAMGSWHISHLDTLHAAGDGSKSI